MRCESPISWETLVAYWAGDLPPAEEEQTELHLLGCASCTAEAERVAAVAQGIRSAPPLRVVAGDPKPPRRRLLYSTVGAATLAAAAAIFFLVPHGAGDFSVRLAAPVRDAVTAEIQPPSGTRDVRLEPEGAGGNAARVRRLDDGKYLDVRVAAGPPFTVVVSKVELTPGLYELQLFQVDGNNEEARGFYRFHVSP